MRGTQKNSIVFVICKRTSEETLRNQHQKIGQQNQIRIIRKRGQEVEENPGEPKQCTVLGPHPSQMLLRGGVE